MDRLHRILAGGLLALSFAVPGSASASGMHIRWVECVADGGVRNLTFACNTNTGTRALVSSFLLTAPLTQVRSLNGTIDIVAEAPVLPAWWNFRQCRSGSISYNSSAAAPVLCPTLRFCSSGIASIQPGVPAVNAERIDFARVFPTTCTILPGLPPSDVAAGTEYVAAVLSMNSTRTVGSPSCDGCDIKVCLTLWRLELTGAEGTVTLTQPEILPDGNTITWQGSGGVFSPCDAATSTRRSGWGAVKALYR
jgi:hypothetical protein